MLKCIPSLLMLTAILAGCEPAGKADLTTDEALLSGGARTHGVDEKPMPPPPPPPPPAYKVSSRPATIPDNMRRIRYRRAPLRICVDAPLNYQYSIALGYLDLKDNVWKSSGWWNLKDGACRTFDWEMGDNLYIHASYGLYANHTGDRGRDFVSDLIVIGSQGIIQGNYDFCVTTEPFNIAGNMRCNSRGYRRARFAEFRMNGHNMIEFREGGRYYIGTYR